MLAFLSSLIKRLHDSYARYHRESVHRSLINLLIRSLAMSPLWGYLPNCTPPLPKISQLARVACHKYHAITRRHGSVEGTRTQHRPLWYVYCQRLLPVYFTTFLLTHCKLAYMQITASGINICFTANEKGCLNHLIFLKCFATSRPRDQCEAAGRKYTKNYDMTLKSDNSAVPTRKELNRTLGTIVIGLCRPPEESTKWREMKHCFFYFSTACLSY